MGWSSASFASRCAGSLPASVSSDLRTARQQTEQLHLIGDAAFLQRSANLSRIAGVACVIDCARANHDRPNATLGEQCKRTENGEMVFVEPELIAHREETLGDLSEFAARK